MTDNVTNIRDSKGKFRKGASGNPHGVSAKHAAIKAMQRQNEVLLTSMITEMVPHAAKLHRALLRDKNLTTKESLELIHLTYRYGIGTPRQAEPAPKVEEEAFDFSEWDDEKREAVIAMLTSTAQGAKPE